MVTCSGRFPNADVAAGLTLRERGLLDALGAVKVAAGAAPADTGGPVCHLATYAFGRPYLSLTRPSGADLAPVAWARLTDEQVGAARISQGRLAPLQQEGDAELESWLATLTPTTLDRIVADITDAVDHTDPVLLYVEDDVFTNFDRFNNLLPKQGGKPAPEHLLSRLPGHPLHELTGNERRLLFGTHLLREAKLSPEEFNGQQLTPWALRTFFERKHGQYVSHGSAEAPWPETLIEQAARLREMKDQLRGSHTVYRWINGINFRKEERWRPHDDWAQLAAELPTSVRTMGKERLSVRWEDFTHHDAYFLEIVRSIARIAEPSRRSEALGALLEAVVKAAMERLPSHLGMTRGMRDLRHFQDALEEGRFDDVCAAPMSDGYCAVFANEGSLGFCGHQPPSKILTAVSRRMQFNHWHYTPGHFDAATLPTRRHYYNPPRMSDVAESADMQHPGHVFAHVRHALRSSAGLTIGGRMYSGLVDIRLMRAVGQPYTDADLRVADGFTEMIRSIAQAVVSLKAEGLRAPVVTGFDRAYYERRYPLPPTPIPHDEAGDSAMPSIGAMLREAVRLHPDTAAIVAGKTGVAGESGRTYSLREISKVGERLVATAGPGGTVVILCTDRVQQAVLITASLAAGLLVCPLDATLPAAAIETVLQHVKPSFVATDLVDGWPRGAAPTPAADTGRPINDDRGGLLVYTSGTTGSPKGVRLSEQQLAENVTFAIAHFGYDATWISGCLLPFHHTFATVSDLLPVLCAGGRVVVTAAFSPTDAGAVAATFAAHRVQSFSSVPLVLDAWLALKVGLPDTLRFAITGASPLSERTRARYLERFGHPVVPCYGLTETVCFATASPVGGGKPGAVGTAAGIQIRVLGPDLNPISVGEHGEIALRGRSVLTSGYYRRGDGAEEPFLEGGWFLTGDMGHLDAEGYLYITGRRKNMIIRGGEKLYLEDLDRCIEEHPSVAEACSVQVPGLFGYERAIAFVVAAHGPQDDGAIRAHVRERMGANGGPDELVWVSRIPRSATGKPLRAALRDRYGAGTWT